MLSGPSYLCLLYCMYEVYYVRTTLCLISPVIPTYTTSSNRAREKKKRKKRKRKEKKRRKKKKTPPGEKKNILPAALIGQLVQVCGRAFALNFPWVYQSVSGRVHIHFLYSLHALYLFYPTLSLPFLFLPAHITNHDDCSFHQIDCSLKVLIQSNYL
ncbi:hypothetical protein GGS21DRAFT_391636 [Xylaria nigripes]|nr:hypothetical protein GGS21DRAFT_391636 [Xylaria nigripes]